MIFITSICMVNFEYSHAYFIHGLCILPERVLQPLLQQRLLPYSGWRECWCAALHALQALLLQCSQHLRHDLRSLSGQDTGHAAINSGHNHACTNDVWHCIGNMHAVALAQSPCVLCYITGLICF